MYSHTHMKYGRVYCGGECTEGFFQTLVSVSFGFGDRITSNDPPNSPQPQPKVHCSDDVAAVVMLTHSRTLFNISNSCNVVYRVSRTASRPLGPTTGGLG